MLPKEMYTWFSVFYTRQAEADYYVCRRSPPPPLPAPHHRFKIDLYVFIYTYIKKEADLTNNSVRHDPPQASGPGGRGGLMQRGGSSRGGLCLQR